MGADVHLNDVFFGIALAVLFRAETAGSAMRLTPVWKLTTDAGSFLVNGLTDEVLLAP